MYPILVVFQSLLGHLHASSDLNFSTTLWRSRRLEEILCWKPSVSGRASVLGQCPVYAFALCILCMRYSVGPFLYFVSFSRMVFTYSFNQFLLSTYSMLIIVLQASNKAVENNDLCLTLQQSGYTLNGNGDNYQHFRACTMYTISSIYIEYSRPLYLMRKLRHKEAIQLVPNN